MKKLFTILSLLFTVTAFCQQYNNEWIDFSKTYYKFKVAQTGLYRIPQSTLNAIGLGATPAEQFKLIRNGIEVPLYASVATGQLGVSDYIEFWGEMNDGKPDKALYRDPSYQHSDAISLLTDTAVFFLTISNSSNLRLTEQANNVASNIQPAETYFMHTAGTHFKVKVNNGFGKLAGEYIYSSSYDIGEYWSTADIGASGTSSTQLNNLFVYTGGPNAYIKFGASGNAPNSRSLNLKINGTTLKDTSFSGFGEIQAPVTFFSPNLISSGPANVVFTNTSAVTTDRMVLSYYDITYPRQFNFGGVKNFPFVLAAKSSDYYLAITNFNRGAALPVLYDLTNRNRYTAVLGGGDTVKFVLPASSQQRNLVLVNEEATNITTITSLTPKSFTNFSDPANQGNYLIISNPILYTGTSGNNPVNDYKNYRSSTVGGGYNVTVADINELVDQFAFGIKKHPLSIKNFLQFARDKYATAPKFVLLIGRGVDYISYGKNQSNALADRINLIPTFGYPASDNMLGSVGPASPIAATPIGRLSVIKGEELENYLAKVKEYELAQRTAPNTIAGRLWMKNVMEITGASQLDLGVTLCNFMHGFKNIIEDTLAGTNVNLFCKNSANPVEMLSSDRVADLFEEGISLLTYFGHSSATTLEFNIESPQNYNNAGKYPVFSVNGCNAGNFFTFDQQRLNTVGTLSENFTLAKERGGIAFLASTHFGLVNYLNIYLNSFYKNASSYKYGRDLGEIFDASLNQLLAVNSPTDFFARAHAEELTLHGDPALKMNFQEKPDYVIEEPQVKISPSFISIAETQFAMNIRIYNLGKAIRDSIIVEVKRQYPNGTTGVIYRQKIPTPLYSDSLILNVPIIGTQEKGTNKLVVTLDPDNEVDEMDESNNTTTKEIFIYEDEARPAFPYNYSIVSDPGQKLYASTSNPFSDIKTYVIEIDTTALFNSPFKVTKEISAPGGIIEINPGITFSDSTVYYWRTSLKPVGAGTYQWSSSSFIYIHNSAKGFTQSHYYQHLNSTFSDILLDQSGTWKFPQTIHTLLLKNTIYGTGGTLDSDFSIEVDDDPIMQSACVGYSLIFNVFHPVSFKPWKNVDANGNNLYLSGSGSANCRPTRNYNFEFAYTSPENRRLMSAFMDSIPNGYYVTVRAINYLAGYGASTWQADTAINGPGNTLYHRLVAAGLTTLDNFNSNRTFAFVYKKGDPSFIPKYAFTINDSDKIALHADCPVPDTLGYVTSPAFGPAKFWRRFLWKGKSLELNSADKVSIDIIGITPSNTEMVLATADKNTTDIDISSISAEQYPYIKLRMRNMDTVTFTPYQLKYWQLDYDPIPEGALAANLYFTTKDTLDVGEKLKFGIAFKNIGPVAFDSVKVKLVILDKDNTSHTIPLSAKLKPIISGDTVRFDYEIDTRDFVGNNTLSVDFNPDNDQVEQYHYNNFLFRDFYVKPDVINPLMDVTFDGIHILNNDIVSSRPHIQIKVKDEAKFMLLNDTSVVSELKVRYPDANGTVRTYKFDNDTLRFTPAQNGTNNTATIDFSPYFPTILDDNGQPLNPDGDTYTLMVKSKDESGNSAGQKEYNVSFKVIDKPMISNLLNYPNPFTTSTAFVFTITGSEVPQNMKIQILTVTGKIVREITREELGPIHIGRNITEYKWNGTDQYGQRLGNGVYLYRVVTTLNGKRMDKFTSDGDDTDKYFTRGYGKMYLMR